MDILRHVESHEIFSSQQIENYRKSVKQSNMGESRVMEEMFADVFADMKTKRRIIEKISEENRSLADRLVEFAKKDVVRSKKFFQSKGSEGKISGNHLDEQAI